MSYLYKGKVVSFAKQLIIGKSGLVLYFNATDAARASFPECILTSKGRFQRTVFAKDATIKREGAGAQTVTYCPGAELGFNLTRIKDDEEKEALKRFTITIK